MRGSQPEPDKAMWPQGLLHIRCTNAVWAWETKIKEGEEGREGGVGESNGHQTLLLSLNIFLSVVVHVCNASTQETEAGAFSVQGQPVAPQRGLFCVSGA